MDSLLKVNNKMTQEELFWLIQKYGDIKFNLKQKLSNNSLSIEKAKKLSDELQKIHLEQVSFIDYLCKNFNVAYPNKDMEGKEPYWDWYNRMLTSLTGKRILK